MSLGMVRALFENPCPKMSMETLPLTGVGGDSRMLSIPGAVLAARTFSLSFAGYVIGLRL